MLDIGWSELLVIGVVALIVVGPKDLPLMFRKLGQFTGQAKAMAREFTSAMDRAADEAGVKDVQKDLRNLSNPRKLGLDAFKDATDEFKNWHPEDDGPKDKKPQGTETQKLSEERAEMSRKINEAAAIRATERKEREAAEAALHQAEPPVTDVDDKTA
ncbi:Sec-independent protein translocase protein TatB [Qingshengfaniella alkalisoli]|uniref:Sec-independent protein translocase protein TatB n=1 Tax=Qingshengfaniella alkalisoli TaxID=2599296 RepID=A0A5B8IW73_9RHOB|nr:Sec-independent protein translocase protein TatB [Qingshengfaniella alkalisoli]QDY68768.1 twin-arginine translocase subunit TatB [Qingshengfaniella alkalisoli]